MNSRQYRNQAVLTFGDRSQLFLARLCQVALVVLLIVVIVPAAGCGPVSNKTRGGGLFGLRGQLASNSTQRTGLGLGGGFGQSVFGNQGPAFGGQGTSAQLASTGAARLQAPGLGGQSNNGQLAAQLNSLNQRVSDFDSDNQLLNTEIAALKQKLQLANNYSQTLKQQLADSSRQAQQFGGQNQEAAQKLLVAEQKIKQLESQNAKLLASSSSSATGGQSNFTQVGFGGSAGAGLPSAVTLRANNTLLQRINEIQIPGGQARVDGDVIRIEFPSDGLFVRGSYQLQPATLPALQGIVGTIRQTFPRQIVGVEAHWDGTPLNPSTTSHHQHTATQALAVFDRLVALGVPRTQLFTMALGSNRPRHSQSTSVGNPNRRIEVVIYPETFDGT